MALFGKKFKNRTFEYIPRFYDQEKEDLERRLGTSPDSNDPNSVKLRIRSGLKRKQKVDSRVASQARKAANVRLLVIIGAIVLLTLLILTKYLPDLMQMTEQ